MKADTINLYMDSIVNGKRVGDMTYDELHELAKNGYRFKANAGILSCSGRKVKKKRLSSDPACMI